LKTACIEVMEFFLVLGVLEEVKAKATRFHTGCHDQNYQLSKGDNNVR
jgi:hypothetical protein